MEVKSWLCLVLLYSVCFFSVCETNVGHSRPQFHSVRTLPLLFVSFAPFLLHEVFPELDVFKYFKFEAYFQQADFS